MRNKTNWLLAALVVVGLVMVGAWIRFLASAGDDARTVGRIRFVSTEDVLLPDGRRVTCVGTANGLSCDWEGAR